MARAENVPVKTLPGLNELITGDRDLAIQIRPVQVEDLLGREPVEVDLEVDPLVSRGQDRARDRRRRLDRLRALPPDRPRRAAADRHRRPGRERPLRHRARARRRAPLQRGRARARRRARPPPDAAGLRALPPRRRLPRGRVQARAADGGEPARVGGEQRARHAVAADAAIAIRRRALRADLDRQGAQPAQRLRPDEDALRVDRRLARRARRRGDASSSRSASATCSTRPAA